MEEIVELLNLNADVIKGDFTLLIPSVSVGNAGQLAIDLLISTHNLKKVGTLWHPGIIPTVGGDPFTSNSTEISTACELYANEEMKIAAIQLRSSIESKMALDFFSKLKDVIVKLNFQSVIILTSAFSYELHSIQSGPFRYISTNFEVQALSNLNIPPLEASEYGGYFIPGSGFAVKLYEILRDVRPCLVLIKYASEGDNRADALDMLQLLHKCVVNFSVEKLEISFPSSWNYVFGNPPPIGIF